MKVTFNSINSIYKAQNFTSKKTFQNRLKNSFNSSNPILINGLGILKPFELAKYMVDSSEDVISRSDKIKDEITNAQNLAHDMQSKAQTFVEFSNYLQKNAKDKIIPCAKQAQKNSREIYQNAQFLQKQAIEKLRQAQQNNFLKNPNISYLIDEDNNKIFIEEFEKNEPEPYRISIFNQDKNNKTISLCNILEGDCDYIYENGQCTDICEGVDEAQDECKKIRKRYTFENAKLTCYEDDVQIYSNNSQNSKNYYTFNNDELTSYINNAKSFIDGREQSDEIYLFQDETLIAFNKNQFVKTDDDVTADETIIFQDGKITRYQYCTQDKNNVLKMQDVFNFSDNRLSSYQKNFSIDDKGLQSSDIEIEYDGEYFREYKEKTKVYSDSSMESEINIKNTYNITQYSTNLSGYANQEGGLDESFIFKNDELSSYTKGVNLFKNGIKKIGQAISFKDGKLNQFASLTQEFKNGDSKSAFILFFKDNKLHRFIQNYYMPAHGRIQTASKNLVVDKNGKLISG